MTEILPLNPADSPAARRMIYSVAHHVFPSGRTLEADIAHYATSWPLHDLDDITHSYVENGGAFLVMVDRHRPPTDQLIGTGAIRRLEAGVCELKRFWFLPEYHGQGQAAALLRHLFALARQMGYHTMRLETSPEYQARAVAFYKKFGFREIPRYGDDPDDIGMERSLLEEDGAGA